MKICVCTKCGSTLVIRKDKTDFPECPVCHKTNVMDTMRFNHVYCEDNHKTKSLSLIYSETPIKGKYCSLHECIEKQKAMTFKEILVWLKNKITRRKNV